MTINKAGAIVRKIENGEVYILLLHLIKHDFWSFPKGHIEEGESAEDTAKREILEETGLVINITKPLGIAKYKDIDGNEVNLNLFLADIESGELVEEEGHELVWLTVDEATEKLTYPELREFLSDKKYEIINLE
ncbi:MAG: NUDIX domain-containing protein [Candidatus Berkelbacteria bacterium]|nr:NUDIX domain-containing protein [Candidatus Berkelbacteria bacterium]